MKPRILLLMSFDEAFYLEPIEEGSQNFSFVKYTGIFNPKDIKNWIDQHKDEFDAVAVYDAPGYSNVRQAMEEHFQGHKILLHTTDSYKPPEGKYLMEVDTINEATKFDKLVQENFEKL